MRVLITGNMGYVGPVVVGHGLRQRHPNAGASIGYDSGLFAGCLTAGSRVAGQTLLNRQHFGDVRDLPAGAFADWRGCCCYISFAVSNDPIGDRFEAVTDAINRHASLRVSASLAAASRVRHFMYASSSTYVHGAAGAQARRESDAINPLSQPMPAQRS